MADRYQLNETLSPIEPSTWRELNENWEFIKSYLRFLQRQLDLISGKDAQEIMDRLDAVITNAENATLNAIEAKQAVDRALVELNALMERAATAAQRAETVADEGNRINTVLSALQLELETLQTNLNTIVQSEAQRMVNEDARVIAEGERADAETTRQNNETTRETNEQARIQSSANATSAANTAAGRAEDAADATILATKEATDATIAAITATNEANVATTGTIQAKTAAEDATAVSIVQTEAAQTATLNANTAADRANEYADEAEFQAFQAENATVEAQDATRAANTATENANTATSNANTATDRANTAATNADSATSAANTAATEAEHQAFQAEDAAQKANVIASNLEGYNMPTVPFSLEATYIKHQHVSSDGSTYQAKVETQGNPLPVFPATSNEWFILVARKGDKGEMGTGLKPLGKKNNASELPLTNNEPGDSYLVGINLYIWDGEGWIDGGPVQGPQGEQGVQGETGVGLQYTWDGTQLGVKRADEATFTYTQLKGEKGDQGEKGDPGANGSDANVTNENVINALGFTPADDVSLVEVDERLTTQLTYTVLDLENRGMNINDYPRLSVEVTDNPRMQRAIDSLGNNTGILFIPIGHYIFSGNLILQNKSNMTILGDYNNTVIQLNSLIKGIVLDTCTNVHILNLKLVGNNVRSYKDTNNTSLIYIFNSSYCSVRNVTLEKWNWAGITIRKSTHCDVFSCTLDGDENTFVDVSHFGIQISSSAKCIVENNNIARCGNGIILGSNIEYTVDDITQSRPIFNNIIKNKISYCTNNGIYQSSGDKNTIDKNIISLCKDSAIKYEGDDGQVTYNKVYKCQNIVTVRAIGNAHGYIIKGNQGLELTGTAGNTGGVHVYSTEVGNLENLIIKDNIIKASSSKTFLHGIFISINSNLLQSLKDVSLKDNIIEGTVKGVYITSPLTTQVVKNIDIEGNKIKNTDQQGILAFGLDNATIENNDISNISDTTNSNGYGIHLYYSKDTSVDKNRIDMAYGGVRIEASNVLIYLGERNNITNTFAGSTMIYNYGTKAILKSGVAIGKTTERPSTPFTGMYYFDHTLNKRIVWNGSAWINVDGVAL